MKATLIILLALLTLAGVTLQFSMYAASPASHGVATWVIWPMLLCAILAYSETQTEEK